MAEILDRACDDQGLEAPLEPVTMSLPPRSYTLRQGGIPYAKQRIALLCRIANLKAKAATETPANATQLSVKVEKLEKELQELPGPFRRSLQAAMRSIHLRTQTHIGGKLDGNNSLKLIKERRVLLEALCRHDLFDVHGNHGSPRAEFTTRWFDEQMLCWNKVKFLVIAFRSCVRCTRSSS
jgi:hypothetical protein